MIFLGKKTVIKIEKRNRKRLIISAIISSCILFALIVRIGYLQFVKGSWLKSQASSNQTSSKTIYAERGTIFDTNGAVLAISAVFDSVSINPSLIQYTNKTEVNKEFLAHSFSSILDLDDDET